MLVLQSINSFSYRVLESRPQKMLVRVSVTSLLDLDAADRIGALMQPAGLI